MKSKSRHPHGFTLVELLVVIVIIAALAALSFTVVLRMKKTANQAVTSANMRQIGIALITFTSDKGRFPSKKGDPIWDRAVFPYLGFSDPMPGTGNIVASKTPSLEGTARIFATPEDLEPRTKDTYKRSFAIVPWTTNLIVGNLFRGWKDRQYDVGVPFSVLDAPERSAMVVQAFFGTANISNNLGSGNHAYSDYGGLAAAGGTFQQVLFADGHIEKVPMKIKPDDFVEKYWPGTIGATK